MDTEDTGGDGQLKAADPRLDFTSPDFDPELALQTTGLQPPKPDAQVLDNISKCSTMLPSAPTEPQKKLTDVEAAEAAAASQARKAKAAALKQRALRAAQRAEASVTIGSLPSIMAKAAVGPLSILAKWQAVGQRVLVVTRHAAGVRGRAVGILRGFDKFMNLILADAEEAYTVIIKVPKYKQQQVLLPGRSGAAAPPTPGAAPATVGCSSSMQNQNADLTHSDQQQDLQQRQQQPPGQSSAVQPGSPPPQQLQQHQQQPRGSQEQHQKQQQAGDKASASRTRVRWCRKQEQRYRRLEQVLILGDNVVLVSGQPPTSLCAPGITSA